MFKSSYKSSLHMHAVAAFNYRFALRILALSESQVEISRLHSEFGFPLDTNIALSFEELQPIASD